VNQQWFLGFSFLAFRGRHVVTLYNDYIIAIKKLQFWKKKWYFLFLIVAAKQKGMILMVSEEFLAEIDAAYPSLGYSDRASFVRAAVHQYLADRGITLPLSFKAAPPRVKKKKAVSDEAMAASPEKIYRTKRGA